MCTGQERSQYPDGHPAVQNTGGQPTPEAVEQAARESGQLAQSVDDWMLTNRWEFWQGHIVCRARPGQSIDFLRVAMYCLDGVGQHICDLHNRAIGFSSGPPSRDAEAPDLSVIDEETA